ncbi:MAG TPA: DUF5715 family protein [Thermoanaerobaculia bacterium]|jgi:hypothetical protein|nr:DUF5715 family protein [Thermoanaerobaculia bacterium]
MMPMLVESQDSIGPRPVLAFLLFLALFLLSFGSQAQSLLGSRDSMLRQSLAAREHDFTYLRTSDDVRDFVDRGLLVRLRGNSNYQLGTVSFPYARPEVKTFIERLASQYKDACRERLVVTSLTRPMTRQPANASHLSVHPTGMAVDLRRSSRPACRAWLEDTLLTLESREVVEATRELRPPHYHVTLFPREYSRYLDTHAEPQVELASNTSSSSSSHKKSVSAKTAKSKKSTRTVSKTYRVGRGDSLWTIAQRHRTTVASIKRANGIRSSQLKPGQVIKLPTTAR